jgi:hypothetical protein
MEGAAGSCPDGLQGCVLRQQQQQQQALCAQQILGKALACHNYLMGGTGRAAWYRKDTTM